MDSTVSPRGNDFDAAFDRNFALAPDILLSVDVKDDRTFTMKLRPGHKWSDGQPFTALNGGPLFRFNEAISLQVVCDTQDEIDHYWQRLGDGVESSRHHPGERGPDSFSIAGERGGTQKCDRPLVLARFASSAGHCAAPH